MGGSADDKPRAPRPGTVSGTPARPRSSKEANSSKEQSKGPRSLIGSIISDRYLIERLLGEGGMGAVYQAEHTLMRKRMAIKVLHPEMTRLPEVVARFEREAMAAAHIDHPHVVTATDFGKLDDGSFFLALEFVEGGSLRELIAKGRLELGRALHIARQIASALQRAHSLKIVHRDLKPENVMLVERDGDPDFVKVLDFGIAKVQMGELGTNNRAGPEQSVLTQAGMIYGTPEYMAPEQALGQSVDARADLYALGVIVYEMLTGHRPFEAESKVALLGMQVTAPVPAMVTKCADSNVPPDVEALVGRLLAKEARERTADAREIIDGVTLVLAQLCASGRIDAKFMPASPSGFATSPGLVSGISHPPLDPALAAAAARIVDTAKPSFSLGGRSWVVAMGAGALGLIVLVTAVLRAGGGHETTGTGASDVTFEDASASSVGDASVDESIREAVAMIERGDYGSGIKRLGELGDSVQGREDVHRALMNAYISTDRMKAAMREAGLVLRANPGLKLLEDKKFRVGVRDLALKEASSDNLQPAVDEAFLLLEEKMGVVGWDDLYSIAHGSAGAQYPKAATRARTAFAHGDRSQMSSSLQVTLDIRAAGVSCAAKNYFERAAKDGDERTLNVLSPLTTAHSIKQSGFRKIDLLACLHDGSLTRTITAINERLRAQERK